MLPTSLLVRYHAVTVDLSLFSSDSLSPTYSGVVGVSLQGWACSCSLSWDSSSGTYTVDVAELVANNGMQGLPCRRERGAQHYLRRLQPSQEECPLSARQRPAFTMRNMEENEDTYNTVCNIPQNLDE